MHRKMPLFFAFVLENPRNKACVKETRGEEARGEGCQGASLL
mgnify:FL=1